MKSGSLETKINHFSNFYGNKVKKKKSFFSKQNAILPTSLYRRGKILKKSKKRVRDIVYVKQLCILVHKTLFNVNFIHNVIFTKHSVKIRLNSV